MARKASVSGATANTKQVGRRPAGVPTNALRRLIELPGKILRTRQIAARFQAALFRDRAELTRYRRELSRSGLIEHLKEQRRWFLESVQGTTARGAPYIIGTVKETEGELLYAIIRKLCPLVAVETGVCAGFSTAFILKALRDNGRGRLYSIDFPEFAGQEYDQGTF